MGDTGAWYDGSEKVNLAPEQPKERSAVTSPSGPLTDLRSVYCHSTEPEVWVGKAIKFQQASFGCIKAFAQFEHDGRLQSLRLSGELIHEKELRALIGFLQEVVGNAR